MFLNNIKESPTNPDAFAQKMSVPDRLTSLQPGESGIIQQLNSTGPIRRRFLDLGLVPGSKIEAVMKSFSGDPVAYRIKGTQLAIRNKDADQIIIKRISIQNKREKL